MIEFYKNIWKGNFDGSDEELEKLLSISSDIIMILSIILDTILKKLKAEPE